MRPASNDASRGLFLSPAPYLVVIVGRAGAASLCDTIASDAPFATVQLGELTKPAA
jgi:hypothetical protein